MTLVFALRSAKITNKDDVVKVLMTDEPESAAVRQERNIVDPVDDDTIVARDHFHLS